MDSADAAPMLESDGADAPRQGAAVTLRRNSRRGHLMSGMKVLAAVLIAGGILGLVYHHFSYTQNTHEAKIGSVELSVAKKESVDVPEWAAVGAIVVGAALLLFGS